MPRFKVTIKAKNLKEALRIVPTASSIEEIEESEPTSNTHAIGFHVPNDQLDIEAF
jgi:hypothetical protein